MTEQVIIEVRDSVDNSVSTKLKAIATSARSAHENVQSLKSSLSSISGLSGITSAQKEVAKLNTENIRAETSSAKLAQAQQQVSLAAERVSTQQARTAQVMAQAQAAQDRAALATLRLETAQNKQAQSLDALRTKYDPLFAVSKQYERALEDIARLEKAGAINATTAASARERAAQQMERGAVSTDKYGRGLRNMSFEAQNASFQLQDVFVTAEMGQSPMRIALQQGTQLSAVLNQMAIKGGGAKGALIGLAQGIGQMINPISLVTLGAVGLSAILIQKAFNAGKAEEGVKSLKESLSDLSGETQDARDQIELFNKGLQTTAQLGVAREIDQITLRISKLQESLSDPNRGRGSSLQNQRLLELREERQELIAILEENQKIIRAQERQQEIRDAAQAAGAAVIARWEREAELRERSLATAQEMLQNLQDQASLSDLINRFGEDSKNVAEARLDIERRVFDEQLKSLDVSEDTKEELIKAWEAANGVADSGIASEISAAATEAEKLAAFLGSSLSTALSLQNLTPTQVDEDAAFAVPVIPDGQQREANRGAVENIGTILERNAKAAERARKSTSRQTEQEKKTLQDYIAELDRELELLKLLPKERQIEQDVLRITTALKKDDISVTQQEIDLIRERAEAVRFANEADKLLQSLPQTAEQRIATLQSMYEQIDFLRSNDLISEQQASQARLSLWADEQHERTRVYSDFFGGIAELASSGNERLARIGKAAAITQTVIDTYSSATAAYAAMAGIPVVGPALGAAAAAAAVAAGLSNVAAIRSQGTSGFMGGGFTGEGARNEVAGAVHRREFVFDAGATSRIGRGDLEALRRGAAQIRRPDLQTPVVVESGPSTTANDGVKSVKIVNVIDPKMMGDYLSTDEGERMIVNVMRRNSTEIKQVIS